MTIFQENRLTVSLKRFVQLEIPKCRLVYYGQNKYYGNCRLLRHRERAGEGQSFLLDEQSGRASCAGKCGFQGADINQIGAYLWDCTNTEAAQRIHAQAKKYGPPRVRNKAKEKKPRAGWDWAKRLDPFPQVEIADLARQRGIHQRGIRRAVRLGLLWWLPYRYNSIKSRRQGDAWVITDRTRQQAMRRRIDGEHWYGGAKSKLLPGCSGKTEIGLSEALAVSEENEIIIVEGGPDLLAALGYFPKCGVICMPSVMTDFSAEARQALKHRRVLFIPHADEAGRKALEKWSKQLGNGENLAWLELDGEGVKDFNDWVRSNTC